MKITFLLISILMLTLPRIFSQVPQTAWNVRFGGSNGDGLLCLQQTFDGGYIFSGYSASAISGDKTQVGWGEEDYWIVKTDVSGIKQWDVSFGGNLSDILTSICQTS